MEKKSNISVRSGGGVLRVVFVTQTSISPEMLNKKCIAPAC